MVRGHRYAVCEKTFELYSQEPYRGQFEHIEPYDTIPPEEAAPFDCDGTRLRHPKETKGQDYDLTLDPSGSGCDSDGCC